MTTTTAPVAQLWSTMPGWGIAADLTPPELVNAREIKRLRLWIALGLAVLLVACVGGFVAASARESSATSELNKAQAQTLQLNAQVRTYAGVTQIQGNTAQIQTQIAALMGSDVDLPGLMARFRAALPSGMTIASEAITISTTAGAATGTGTGTAATIAAVTMSGTGHKLADLATFAENLGEITGVVDVIPTTNVADNNLARYSVSLNLTTAALSHRFDVSKTGTK